MSDDIDFNKLIVEFVNAHIESFYTASLGVLKGATDKIRMHLDKSYKDYLRCVTERYSKAKSFFIRTEPTYLYDFYVPVGVSKRIDKYDFSEPSRYLDRRSEASHTSLVEISRINRFAVITGSGGSGKSMFMRHLLLQNIIEKQKVPVFVELRELNQTEQSLLDAIRESLYANHFELDAAYIDKAMRAGHFAFLFDGFDELEHTVRKRVRSEIVHLAQHYDRNVYIVASRPDDEFSGWHWATVLHINPITLDQACALIEKVPFDYEIKAKFIRDLRSKLFAKHYSFLSNPLLLSIMLLTYGQSADIPSKLSVFYSQAYEALFQRHDALKGGYQRKRSSDLDIQDFAKVFAAFSILTFDKRIFQMPRIEALDFLEASKRLSNVEFNADSYLKDAEQAVCLLIEDGLQVVFAHRSFQEYFTARFILTAPSGAQKKLIDKYAKGMEQDSVIAILHELNPELIERYFIIPSIEDLERSLKIKGTVDSTQYARYIKKMLSTIQVVRHKKHEEVSFKVSLDVISSDLSPLFHFVESTYNLDTKPDTSLSNSEFWNNYIKRNHSTTEEEEQGFSIDIDISRLKAEDEVIRFLAENSGFFSQTMLESVLHLKNDLVQKLKDIDQSLEEILSLDKRK